MLYNPIIFIISFLMKFLFNKLSFWKILFLFLSCLLLFSFGSLVAEDIELLNVSEEIQKSYERMMYPEDSKNLTDFLLYRVKIITDFLLYRVKIITDYWLQGHEFKIPEYAVVINACIQYLKRFSVRQEPEFLLERQILDSLKQTVERFRADVTYPHNLKYIEVILSQEHL